MFQPSPPTGSARGVRSGNRSRTAPPPNPLWPPLAVLVATAGFAAVMATGLVNETKAELALSGGPATYAGSLLGLAGTYLTLIMVLLVSRIPAVERVLGQDGLLRWHRRISPWPITLLLLHAVFIVIGYGQASHVGFWHELVTQIRTLADVLAATIGLLIMVAIGIISIRAIRVRLSRETWWAIHLYMYLAIALSFAHAVALGPSFVGHPLTRLIWSIAWLATAGLVLTYRFGLPIWRSLRHNLRVESVQPAADSTVSVVLKGHRLERLPASGGQFMLWRFLSPGMFWQAHPYSLSARPRPPYLRITVKALGDHSEALANLRPGVRVFVEGPYGAFTAHARTRPRAALLAGGIGVTAIRALLEDLPASSHPIVVIRANDAEQLALGQEIAELTRLRGGRVIKIIGPRESYSFTPESIRELVPDLSKRDFFICGPPSFVVDAAQSARAAGVPRSALHFEEFAL